MRVSLSCQLGVESLTNPTCIFSGCYVSLFYKVHGCISNYRKINNEDSIITEKFKFWFSRHSSTCSHPDNLEKNQWSWKFVWNKPTNAPNTIKFAWDIFHLLPAFMSQPHNFSAEENSSKRSGQSLKTFSQSLSETQFCNRSPLFLQHVNTYDKLVDSGPLYHLTWPVFLVQHNLIVYIHNTVLVYIHNTVLVYINQLGGRVLSQKSAGHCYSLSLSLSLSLSFQTSP
jgi:hypothetical protein